MTKIFISYQTADGSIASRLQKSLSAFGLNSFLAHEDIVVSEVWRTRILEELYTSDICVCLLSTHYLESVWCVQEAGISAFHKGMIPIPLRLDDSLPPGFLNVIQAVKCDPDSISIIDILPGMLHGGSSAGVDIAISLIEGSRSYRWSETYYQILLPYIQNLTDNQAIRLLNVTRNNGQVFDAGLCAREYVPQVLTLFGHLIPQELKIELLDNCNQYRSFANLDEIS